MSRLVPQLPANVGFTPDVAGAGPPDSRTPKTPIEGTIANTGRGTRPRDKEE
jgi:hypothetical protein